MSSKKKTKSVSRITPSLASADDSGAFDEVPDSIMPIVPLLKQSVRHMREGNEHQKTTNKRLVRLDASLARQNHLLWVGAVIGAFLLAGLIFSLVAQRVMGQHLEATNAKLDRTNVALNLVSKRLGEIAKKTREVKQKIDEQPTITVRPANTSDPSSRPSLVVEPPKSRPSQQPKATGAEPVEFPLGPARRKKKKK